MPGIGRFLPAGECTFAARRPQGKEPRTVGDLPAPRPSGPSRHRCQRSISPSSSSARSTARAIWLVAILVAIAIAVPALNLLVPPGQFGHVPGYAVTLFGKYLCYAMLALALDLVWGYVGILSLGHGAFFALGGYAMGMYLMRQIGSAGRLCQPDPARFHGVPELQGTALVLATASTCSGSPC